MNLHPGCSSLKILKTAPMFLLLAATISAHGNVSHSYEIKTVFFNSFEAKVSNTAVEFSWAVTEYNNKSFELQHSLDGSNWEEVGLIPSKRSVESLERYSFRLTNTAIGRHYYRLKHTDVDLKEVGYSAVRIITIKDEHQDFSVWPNPASGSVNIANNGTGLHFYTTAKIFDLSGHLMSVAKLSAGTNILDLSMLTPGIYLLNIANKEGNFFNQRLVKQ